jgi:hypothetical protein
MKLLDLDMDYFITEPPFHISENEKDRLDEKNYGDCVWGKDDVVKFLENNLGLNKERKIPGRIVVGHNEAIHFWKELIQDNKLTVPFEVVHVDSHGDLGLGYSSWEYILDTLLSYPVDERPSKNKYLDINNTQREEGIGDYLLFAIAYRWISKLIFCANPKDDKKNFLPFIIKDLEIIWVNDDPVETAIQLLQNPNIPPPLESAPETEKKKYVCTSTIKEPPIPFIIIPSIEKVKFYGDFNYAVLAQSPNYTPASADFIIDIFREYIEEI